MYALKRVKINKMSKKEISDALNEIRFLASIRHKNIVGFLEAFLENNETELCIVMEYCGCGDLAQKVERYKRRRQYIDEDVIWRYLIQCIKALENLHGRGICHRDIKVANSFLSEDGSVKIGDMNVSKRLNKGHLHTQIGTPYYMSPEIWNNRAYDSSSDIWSLGCMIYELCALKPPFTGNSFPELKRAVIAGRFSPIPRKFSDSLRTVISSMLRVSSRERPSAARMLKTPEIQAKLHLDEIRAAQPVPSQHEAHAKLMQTIKVPQNLRRLNNGLLPKPCYPDARPNSPTSWTVAEQAYAHKKAVKAAAAAEAAAAADGCVPAPPAPTAAAESAPPAPAPPAPAQLAPVQNENPTKEGKAKAPSAAALADYYVRRPLAAADNAPAPSKRDHQPVPPRRAGDYRHIESRYAQYNKPSQRRREDEAINRPRIPYSHGQYGGNPRVAGHPVRVQYQHRMW